MDGSEEKMRVDIDLGLQGLWWVRDRYKSKLVLASRAAIKLAVKHKLELVQIAGTVWRICANFDTDPKCSMSLASDFTSRNTT